jgi:hypothetical protein
MKWRDRLKVPWRSGQPGKTTPVHTAPTSPCHLASVSVLLISMTLAIARAQAQSGTACADPRLRVEGAFHVRWLEPMVHLCETLSAMREVDPSAQLRLVAAGHDVIVEVTLADGRSTLRRVRAPSDLSQTVEALIALPPEPLPERASPPRVTAPPVGLRFHEHPHPSPMRRRFDLELGVEVVGRAAGPTHYASVGVTGYAGLRSGPWLLALNGRFDGYRALLDDRPRDFEMTSAGGGFTLLRELAVFERGTFEAGLASWLLGETQAYTPKTVELTFSSFDLRVSALARWLFGRAPFRPFFSLEAELSPSRVRHSLHLNEDLPALASWSAGLAIGIAWEAR